ncbi:MAG: BlaR1 family beta-lactam sensor/signal transducer [Firmicutes bacterium HGW-Firmicutes-7]|nr:MAG: BlaR1 family beta-lactam sensor/signal transducer [Firmicutes bacterium HGW-Firmicutes-7]
MIEVFFARFLISTLVSSAIILVILLIKRVLKKHIAIRWQYNIWFLLLGMLSIPFIPSPFLNYSNLHNLMFNSINSTKNMTDHISPLNDGGNNFFNNANWNWLQDFTTSVTQSTPVYLNLLFIGIWIIGIFVFAVATIRCNYNIKRIKRSVQRVQNKETEQIFTQCKTDLRIRRKLIFGESNLVQTPMAIGLFKPYIILPAHIVKQLSTNDINCIILHELYHYKNKDILINYVMCLFQILYWFNPLVFLAFKEMRIDREIACDIAVLSMLHEENYLDYGRTIIKFAEKLSHPSYLTVAADMGASKKQIKKRIEKIASFTVESKLLRMKSIGVFMLIGFLIISQVPVISAVTYIDNKYNFHEKQVIYEDLSSYFDDFDGSFVLYDLQAEQYRIYNERKSITRVSPNSTYKIFSALLALELNVIQEGASTLKWNGMTYPYEAWNQDQDLPLAMKNSATWYFQAIDKVIGIKKLKNYYKEIDYGNYNLSGGISDYWMESSLRISPVEQVQLLTDFYRNDMGFKEECIDIVKSVIKLSEKDGAILSGKTGSGVVNDKGIRGWFIGYVEKNGQLFIFATNIEGENNASGSVAANITLSILNDKNIY